MPIMITRRSVCIGGMAGAAAGMVSPLPAYAQASVRRGTPLLPILPSMDRDGRTTLTPEKRRLVERVRTEWRAADGLTVDEVVAQASRVIGWYRPRGLKAEIGWPDTSGRGGYTGSGTFVLLVISDIDDLGWYFQRDGRFQIGPFDFQLGAVPYALNLLRFGRDALSQGERAYFRDVRNLDFIRTSNGGLGAVLSAARCQVSDFKVDYDTPSGMFVADISLEMPQVGGRSGRRGVTLTFEHPRATLLRSPQDGEWSPKGDAATQVATRRPGEWTFAGP